MLSKPNAGWTVVTIGKMKFNASYLADIPMDCLTAAKSYLSGDPLLALFFDLEEEGVLYVLSDKLGTFVITETDEWDDEINDFKYKIDRIGVPAETLIQEIVQDIRMNIHEWADWFCDEGPDPEKHVTIEKLLKEVSEAQKIYQKEHKNYWK